MWVRLHRTLMDRLGAGGALDWPRGAIGSVSVRAVKRGPLTEPN